ncbi:MAG: hypothetical protein OHK0012_03480 [Synechococcales cyanobacterium]
MNMMRVELGLLQIPKDGPVIISSGKLCKPSTAWSIGVGAGVIRSLGMALE